MSFSDDEKLACLRRELGMRRALYPNRVRSGLMRAANAQREIAIIEEIIADYRAKAQPALEFPKDPDGST
jgi:hypothetical protein